MASKLEPLVIELRTEITKALADLDKVKGKLSQVEGQTKASHKEFGSLGSSLGELGKVAAEAFAAVEVVKFLGESSRAAVTSAKSFNLMALQLKNSTGATREYSEQLDKQLEEMSIATGTLMPSLRDNYSKLVRVTNDSAKALQLEAMAQNIAAGTGKDLSATSQALARAYDGNWGALQRLVPGIKSASDKMAYLEQTFAGAAETAAKADPYARLQASMEAIQVSVGQALVPALNSLADIVAKIAPKVQEFMAKFTASAGFQSFVNVYLPKMVSYASQLGDSVFPILADATGIVQSAIQIATSSINNFNKTKDGVLALLGAVKSLADFLNEAIAGFSKYQKGFDDFFRGWSALGPISKGVAAGFKAALDPLGTLLTQLGLINEEINKTGFNFDSLARAGARFQNTILGEGAATGMDIFQGYGARPDTYRPPVDLTGGGSGSGASVAAATKAAADAFAAALKTMDDAQAQYVKDSTDRIKQFQADMRTAQKEHQTAIRDIMAQGRDNLAAIIRSSKDLLTNAFRDATKIDAGSMFMQAGMNVDNMLHMLKDKLAANKDFATDLGKLSGLGYSQEFIDQITAQGPQMGDQMAKQLIAAGPAQTAELQSMFSQVQNQSAHGVDALADDIYKKSGLATEGLKEQYKTAHHDLVAALNAENRAYVNSLNKLVRDYKVAMATLAATRDQAQIDALNTIPGQYNPATMAGLQADLQAQNQIINTPGAPTYNVNVQTTSNATAQVIAQAVLDAIKYNKPVVV